MAPLISTFSKSMMLICRSGLSGKSNLTLLDLVITSGDYQD